MAKQRFPRLQIEVTPDIWETAKEAASGSCLIADAIKAQYPHLSKVTVDTATVRLSDRQAGYRYTYLTPTNAQDLLYAFDRGFAEPEDHSILLRNPVKADLIRTNRVQKAEREEKLMRLRAQRDRGEALSVQDRRALAMMERSEAAGTSSADRPTSGGPVTDVIPRREGNATVVGGRPIRRPPPTPNLLAGRNRIFGARTSRPARVFEQAVEQEVVRRLAETAEGATQDGNPGQ